MLKERIIRDLLDGHIYVSEDKKREYVWSGAEFTCINDSGGHIIVSLDEILDEVGLERVNYDLNLSELRSVTEARTKEFPSKCEFTPTFWMTALAGEVGELCNFVKKEVRDGVDNSKDINKEIADILIYLDCFAASRGVNLSKVTRDKFNEVSDRIGCNIKL